jgi:hypothetical protein
MEIEFYDVKSRQKVKVPISEIKKVKFTRTGKDGSLQTRYAVKSTYNGMKLTKFVSQKDFDTLTVPEETT